MSKNIHLSQAKIVGLSKKGNWSQTFSFENIFGVLEIRGPEGFEVPLLGKSLIEEIQKKYSACQEKNLEFLKAVLLLIKEKENGDKNINASLVLRIGLILYLGTYRQGKVIIKREGKILPVLNGSQDVETASGFLKNNDRIILETESFGRVVDQEKLQQALDDKEVQESADILAPIIQSEEDQSGAGLILKAEIIVQEEAVSQPIEDKGTPPAEPGKELPESSLAKKPKINFQFKFKKPLKEGVGNFFSKAATAFSSLTKNRSIYVHPTEEEGQPKKKITKTIALIILILLIASVFFNLNKNFTSQARKDYDSAYKIAAKKEKEAIGIIDMNPVRSRELLVQARQEMEKLLPKITKDKKLTKSSQEFLDQINSEYETAARVYRIKQLSSFYSLSLIKKEASGEKFTMIGNDFYILDRKNISLYKLNSENKSQSILAKNNAFGKGLKIAGADNVYVLTDTQVFQVNPEDKKTKSLITIDENKENIIDISAFLTNIYLLDSKNNRVLKYILSGNEASLSNYFNQNTVPDLADGLSLAIDGAVYIGKKDGQILKFLQGAPAPFKISDLDKPLGEIKKIYTGPDFKNLYILDRTNYRIVVLDKNGLYQSQYINKEIGEASDLAVSPDEKKIYLLFEDQIKQIQAK